MSLTYYDRQKMRRPLGALSDWASLYVPLLLLLYATLVRAQDARTVSISGEGSTSPSALYMQFSAVYPATQIARNAFSFFPYNSTNSEHGARAVLEGRIDWAATDLALTPQEVNAGMRLVPVFIGGVVVLYNFPPLYNSPYPLNISQEALVGIFNGTIASWDSPLILKANPYLESVNLNATLRRKPFIVVRDDNGSGQVGTFTAGLAAMDKNWNATYGVIQDGTKMPNYSLAVPPSKVGLEAWSHDYSITFGELQTSEQFQLPFAAIQNREGKFVLPSNSSYRRAAKAFQQEAATLPLTNLFIRLVNGDGNETYPIASVSYIILKNGNPADCYSNYELIRYIYWISNSSIADSIAGFYGFAVAGEMDEFAKEILSEFRCGSGMNILEAVLSDISNEEGGDTKGKVYVISVSIMGGLVALLLGLLAYYFWKKEKERKKRIASGETEEVKVPTTVQEKTQRELRDLNEKAVVATAATEADVALGAVADLAETGDTDSPPKAAATTTIKEASEATPVTSPFIRTTLFHSATGGTRAVLGPAVNTAELWRYTDKLPLTKVVSPADKDKSDKDRDGDLKAKELAEAEKQSVKDDEPPPIAEPITVKLPWHRSFPIHVIWVGIRLLTDAVTVSLNWRGYQTLPKGLLMASVYAALCVVGTVFFAFNTLASIAGLLYHQRNGVEIETRLVRSREKAEISQLAYIKSEVRRLQLLVWREGVTKVSLLLREIPFIIVSIVVIDQTIFSQIFVILALAANCISMGFKIHSVGGTIRFFNAYLDMKELYSVLETPISSAVTAPAVKDAVLATGTAEPKFLVHSTKGGESGKVRDVLMTLQSTGDATDDQVKKDMDAALATIDAGGVDWFEAKQ